MPKIDVKKADLAAIIIAGLLLIGLGAFIVTRVVSDNTNKAAAHTKYQAVNPCDLFTLDEAKAVLGESAALAQDNKPKSNGDLSIASCSYGVRGATDADTKIASLTVRSALTDAGVKSNQVGFNQNKSTSAMEDVTGYGDAAYYDAAQGQLNVHDGRNWMIITNGKTDPSGDTLDDAKLVADKVFN